MAGILWCVCVCVCVWGGGGGGGEVDPCRADCIIWNINNFSTPNGPVSYDSQNTLWTRQIYETFLYIYSPYIAQHIT